MGRKKECLKAEASNRRGAAGREETPNREARLESMPFPVFK